MYTRSRSSTGGPGFGNGRGGGQMNSGNANSFQSQNPYNNQQQQHHQQQQQQQQQGGNYMQSGNYKAGILEPSQPFKPAQSPMVQQQAMNQRGQQQGGNQQQQPGSNPTTPRLKPILKQSTPGQGQQAANAAPTPVPAPTPAPTANSNVSQAANQPAANKNLAPGAPPTIKSDATTPKKADNAPDGSMKNENDPSAAEGLDGDDSRKWTEDEQGKWGDDEQGGQWMDTEDGQQERPKWRRFKKLSTNKPNKKLKRLRMNQRLRKALMPKNAIMVLNEMKAGVHFTFPETQAIMPNSLFLVHAELEGKVYVGQGLSKPLARQNAAENALKCLLLEKMTAAAMKERVESETDTSMETQPISSGDGATGGAAAGTGTAATPAAPGSKEENGEETTEDNDDVPWSSLASFALYKLFLEWQNQGTVVPIPRPGVPAPAKNKAEPKPTTEKQLPPNASEIHPVMLLNQMRPGTTYTEVGRVGTPPNIQFTLGVEINGTTYTGSAKNKKDAKKLAAKEALKALYNLDYPEEAKMDATDGAQ